jgi:hypothetical protein
MTAKNEASEKRWNKRIIDAEVMYLPWQQNVRAKISFSETKNGQLSFLLQYLTRLEKNILPRMSSVRHLKNARNDFDIFFA